MTESACTWEQRLGRNATAADAQVQGQERFLWTYLRMLGCPPSEADDLVQDVFLVTLRRVELPDPLRPFLLRTAKNLWLGHMRKQARAPIATDWVDRVDRSWERQAQLAEDDWLDALAACRGKLSARHREALHLYYGHDFGLAETATRLGLKTNGLKTLLQRLRADLRACIRRRLS